MLQTWNIVLIVVLIVIGILIDYFLAVQAAKIAEEKGYEPKGCKWVCFFFGIIGYILVAAMPDLKTREVLEKISAQLAGKSAKEE